jgi:hypothetical protein
MSFSVNNTEAMRLSVQVSKVNRTGKRAERKRVTLLLQSWQLIDFIRR